MHHVWRSNGGVTYHFERFLDHQGEHFQCQTDDLVMIGYELNPGVPFLQWCLKLLATTDV